MVLVILIVGLLAAPARSANPPTAPIVEENSAAFQPLPPEKQPPHVFNPAEGMPTPVGCAKALVFRFAEGPIVGVCDDSAQPLAPGLYRIAASGYDVEMGVKEPSGAMKPLEVEGGVGGHPAELRAGPGSQIVVTELLEDYQEGRPPRFYPFVRRTIVCSSETCRTTADQCVLDVPKNPYPEAAHNLKKKLAKDKNTFDDVLLLRVYWQAMSGDRAAAHLLMDYPGEADAGNAEGLAYLKDDYAYARKLHCPGIF